MAVSTERAIARLAAVQAGLISRAQLLRLGVTPDGIKHRLLMGRLAIVLPKVYALPGTPELSVRSLWAACLWQGDGTAASHSAAAKAWGFDGFR